MVAQVFCLTSNGGLPLLVRKKGDTEALSFSYIASLNGVHMFAKSQGVCLEDTVSSNFIVRWKEYHNSLILIGMSSTVCSKTLLEFLDSVFDAMILCLGIDELTLSRNPEKLKRELRVTYKLIDKLLDNLEPSDKVKSKNMDGYSGNLDDFVETILCQEAQALQNCLDCFLESVDSPFGCMTAHGRLVVASNSWWELNPADKKLLSAFISILNENTVSSDVPVFLPHRSPSIAFRLVTIHLLNDVEVSMLCGPEPSICEIEKCSMQIWRPVVDILRLSEKTFPRNVPAAIAADSNVLGFMLLNIPDRKYVLSRIVPKKEPFCGGHRSNILKTFYKHSVSLFLMCENNPKDRLGLESYWCSEYHKCHALQRGSNLICVLYAAHVPPHTMRWKIYHLRKTQTVLNVCHQEVPIARHKEN